MKPLSILLIGGGGREHALAWKIAQSAFCERLIAAPGNPGIAQVAECVSLDVSDHDAVAQFVKDQDIGLVVVGPEQPLVDGLADSLKTHGIEVFGPSKAAAQLEGSKAFSKAFMQRHGIPTADSVTFAASEKPAAEDWIRQNKDYPVVLKADGLAAGKGVFICGNEDEALTRLDQMLSDPQFRDASQTLVIEEFMEGEEVSVFALCDGQKGLLVGNAQDHKRIGDGDTGLNTGGMGAYSPAPLLTSDLEKTVVERVLKPTLQGMAQEGVPYVGVLYMGLMITAEGPKVVEYNCRFGDPECQVLMLLLAEDLVPLMTAAAAGLLPDRPLNLKPGYVACVVMASKGYPESHQKGFPITGIEHIPAASQAFHSGTALKNGELVSNGGRVLCVAAQGPALAEAIETAYEAVRSIYFENAYFRTDIGQKGLRRLGQKG